MIEVLKNGFQMLRLDKGQAEILTHLNFIEKSSIEEEIDEEEIKRSLIRYVLKRRNLFF